MAKINYTLRHNLGSFHYEECVVECKDSNELLAVRKKLREIFPCKHDASIPTAAQVNARANGYGAGKYPSKYPLKGQVSEDLSHLPYAYAVPWEASESNPNIKMTLKAAGFRYWGKKSGGDGNWYGPVLVTEPDEITQYLVKQPGGAPAPSEVAADTFGDDDIPF